MRCTVTDLFDSLEFQPSCKVYQPAGGNFGPHRYTIRYFIQNSVLRCAKKGICCYILRPFCISLHWHYVTARWNFFHICLKLLHLQVVRKIHMLHKTLAVVRNKFGLGNKSSINISADIQPKKWLAATWAACLASQPHFAENCGWSPS